MEIVNIWTHSIRAHVHEPIAILHVVLVVDHRRNHHRPPKLVLDPFYLVFNLQFIYFTRKYIALVLCFIGISLVRFWLAPSTWLIFPSDKLIRSFFFFHDSFCIKLFSWILFNECVAHRISILITPNDLPHFTQSTEASEMNKMREKTMKLMLILFRLLLVFDK